MKKRMRKQSLVQTDPAQRDRKTKAIRLVDVDELLRRYDETHVGEPGNARKLIEEAPIVLYFLPEQITREIDQNSSYFA